MKKLCLLLSLWLPLTSQSQPPEGQDWWACQSVARSGLTYENRKWQGSDFEHDKRFVLISDGENLDAESVAKAMFVSLKPEDVICNPPLFKRSISCYSNTSAVAVSLHFDRKYGNGAIHFGDGGGKPGGYRDSLYVTAFECAKG